MKLIYLFLYLAIVLQTHVSCASSSCNKKSKVVENIVSYLDGDYEVKFLFVENNEKAVVELFDLNSEGNASILIGGEYTTDPSGRLTFVINQDPVQGYSGYRRPILNIDSYETIWVSVGHRYYPVTLVNQGGKSYTGSALIDVKIRDSYIITQKINIITRDPSQLADFFDAIQLEIEVNEVKHGEGQGNRIKSPLNSDHF